MHSFYTDEALQIGDWNVDPRLLQISNGKEVRKLEARSMQILLYLASKEGGVVSKQELHEAIWGEILVTENALTRAVSRLRKALGDDPLNPSYIDTISKSGYRLIASIRRKEKAATDNGVVTTPSVEPRWNIWLAVGIAVFIVTAFGLVQTLSNKTDKFLSFYDPIPVSTLIGTEFEPAISPDGEKISFSYMQPGQNNMDLYIKLLEDRSQIRFTDHPTPQAAGVWSPDGKYLAYLSAEDSTCGIYKVPDIGGDKVRIGTCYSRPRDLGWSPDGSTLAFTDAETPSEPRSIFFLDIETQSTEKITAPESGDWDKDPVFTPDGKFMVFNRKLSGLRGDIFKMNLESKEITQLTFDNASILGLDIFNSGENIAFSSNRGGQRALWNIPIEGGEPVRFHINERVPTDPKFALQKNRMIYKSNIDQAHLWVIDAQEIEPTPRQIAGSSRAEIHPSLSHKGDKLTFISNRTGNFELWLTSVEDDNPVKLTTSNAGFINKPAWSSDDSRIAFDARIDGDHDIYEVDIASKSMQAIVDLEGDQVNAHYSRDGKYLYFASNHTGQQEIWKHSLIDGSLVQLTDRGGYYLQEGLNGEYLYFTRSDSAGLWRMPISDTGKAFQFIPQLSVIDWGNWVLTEKGIVFVDRSQGVQIKLQAYDSQVCTPIFAPEKPIQIGSPTLTVSRDGDVIILAQIERREDEIMMIDFE